MAKTIIPGQDETHMDEAVEAFKRARRPGALTGAGISVESGIPDFRSPGGLWSIFDPQEYATIDTFVSNPEKSWIFFRALGKTLKDRNPNPAHLSLARLEEAGFLQFVITQNIDGLHNAAGSREVIAVHGDNRFLHCLDCGEMVNVSDDHFDEGPVPECPRCRQPLKPRVVLFGEAVLDIDRCLARLEDCDALLVVGTSSLVYPAAEFPRIVKRRGGLVLEFNLGETPLTKGASFFGIPDAGGGSDYLFLGPASVTLRRFANLVLERH
jgi:NAD-dependent deacetylase